MAYIDHYTFGMIVVDGVEYRTDLLILPGRIIDNWWREEGHRLQLGDIEIVFTTPIYALIVGTGAYGMMHVDPAVEDLLKERGIELIAMPTQQACHLFNQRVKEAPERIGGAFHLTC